MLSAEQPQMLQSPEHSPVSEWANVFYCSARKPRGLNEIIRKINVNKAAMMLRFDRFMLCVNFINIVALIIACITE